MQNRFFALLLITFIFVGCNTKQPQQPAVAPGGAAPTESTLGIPMPTDEILAALGEENDIPIHRLLPDALVVMTGKPKQLLASPISAGGEMLVASFIIRGLQPIQCNPNSIESFVQSHGVPMMVSARQDPNEPAQPRSVLVPRRATIITFDQDLDVTTILGIEDSDVLESLKRKEGETVYYDLTPKDFDGPIRFVIGLLDEKTAVVVEGNDKDVKAVFSDAVPNNAVLARLKRTPIDGNELTVLSSLEGLAMSPEVLDNMLGLDGVEPGSIPSIVRPLIKEHLRALTLSLNVSAAVGQPIISLYVEGRDENSAEKIGNDVESLRLTYQTMSEAVKRTLPIPIDLADSLVNALDVKVEGTRVHVVLNNFDTLIPTVAESLSNAQADIELARLQQRRTGQLFGLWALFAKYYQERQKFPADILDADGKPLLSWRVDLLQAMEGGGELYNKFKLDEPWDSEANLEVLNAPNSKPIIYHPMTEDVQPPKTVIRFFDSAGTPFSKRDLKIEDIKSPETTMMFVMVTPKYAVEWTKPDSLEFDIDTMEDILGSPRFWGITFSGQILHPLTAMPNTDSMYDEWKREIEMLFKVLPVEESRPLEPAESVDEEE